MGGDLAGGHTVPDTSARAVIGPALAGVAVVVALAALARLLEQTVPVATKGTSFAGFAAAVEFPIYAIVLGLLGNAVLTRLGLRDRLAGGFRTTRCRAAADPATPTHPETEHTMTRPGPGPRTRDTVRRSIADQLLSALDDLVTRHRALALHGEHVELHAELIAAEVAHQLAMTRSALHRHPQIRSAPLDDDPARRAG